MRSWRTSQPSADAIHRYTDAFHGIEELVAVKARTDQAYAIREAWLTASSDLRDGYLTLQTRSSRRKGCQVDDGNRRVAERLRAADKAAEDGRLPDAWRYVRLAIERLYTLAKHRADDSFDPEQWRDHDARYMWNHGVEGIVETACPGSGYRLSEVLTFAAEGAHDKSTRGETDVHDRAV